MLKIEYAVTDESDRVWVHHRVAFCYAATGLNTFPKEKAERIMSKRGGKLVPIVLEDEHGPCCYELNGFCIRAGCDHFTQGCLDHKCGFQWTRNMP